MIKKSLCLLLTSILILGLAACNKSDINKGNDQRTSMLNRNNNNRNNDILNVRNGRDDGIDHNGPLTEDYTNRDNNDQDADINLFNDKSKNRRNDKNEMISSYRTSMNSNQYPQTRAVLIQEAKYQFIPSGFGQGFEFQDKSPQQAQPYNQQQRPTVQEPTQQPAPQGTQPAPEQQLPTQPKQTQTNATGDISQYVQQVIDLTNAERRKNGLPALKGDSQLSGVAQKKSIDMQQKNYFSHTSPTFGSPFDMMRDFGVTYNSAAENIAQGQKTPQEVVTAWMNSEGHRKNILSRDFTNIGVGFEQTGYHWTQMFIGK